jgi:UDP-N-acetylglucosamine acyltransferase
LYRDGLTLEQARQRIAAIGQGGDDERAVADLLGDFLAGVDARRGVVR